jgi:hypothetical protein
MTTVVDPLGTPVVYFNKSGHAIIEMAGGDGIGSPAQIPDVSGHTIVVVTEGDPHGYISLPVNADVGDSVEIYTEIGAWFVVAPAGATWGSRGGGQAGFYRKVSPTVWKWLIAT